ncbi:MAG: DUF937 domain-containing protein [Saprospiraceae bacterium]
MSNLLDVIKPLITQQLINKASETLGENENVINKAIQALIPSILGGLVGKASDKSGFQSVFNAISNFNPSVLDNLSGLIGGGNLAHNDPKDASGQLLGALFGSKVKGLAGAVANFSGARENSVTSLMGLVGPAIMGFLSKKIQTEGLNAAGLANLLLGQKNQIFSALPAGIGSALGLSLPTIDAPKATEGRSWLWPLLALLALGAAVIYYMNYCNRPTEAKMETPAIVEKTQDAVNNAAQSAADYMTKLATGFELRGVKGGIENALIEFIQSDKPVDKTTWFNFDRLTFRTGSAEIDMDKSQDQLNNIYQILKAFPKVKLKVGGYTDNTGNEDLNMKLSQDRANATVAALESMGVEKGRLSAEGYGSQHPVASNDTEEGRAQNRRIAVRVMEK